jgi:uncharacterized protein (DUF2141 family)
MIGTSHFLAVLTTLAPILIASAARSATATEISVTITGTQASGKVFGRVFGDADTFKAQVRPVTQFAADPRGETSVRTTLNLPPGRYAIALFQDAKGTGKLETNLFGVPKVPYGFSNDAMGKIGRPGFDAAAFDVGTTPKSLTITLR